jgi:hypothetical protein
VGTANFSQSAILEKKEFNVCWWPTNSKMTFSRGIFFIKGAFINLRKSHQGDTSIEITHPEFAYPACTRTVATKQAHTRRKMHH